MFLPDASLSSRAGGRPYSLRKPFILASLLVLFSILLPHSAFAIFGGAAESGFEAVGAVSLAYSGGGAGLVTGILVGDSWVLTVADAYKPGCTAYFLLGDDVGSYTERIAVSEFILHPDYDASTRANNVALLRLETPATRATPMPLSTATSASLLTMDVRLVGFGIEAIGGVVEGVKRSCNQEFESYTNGWLFMNSLTRACGPYSGGDSGSPAIVLEAGSPRVAATCFYFSEEAPPQNAYYLYTPAVLDFISQNMGAVGNSAPGAPELLSPDDGAGAGVAVPVQISWNSGVDPDGDKVDYRVIVSDNADFSDSRIYDFEGLAAVPGTSPMAHAGGALACSCALLLLCFAVPAARKSRIWAVFFLLAVLLSCSNPAAGPTTEPAPTEPVPGPVPSPPGGSPGASPVRIDNSLSGLSADTTYYWKVEAVDGHGSATQSAARSFTTAP